MRIAERLRKEALESCKWRGHGMKQFHWQNKNRAFACCKRCSAFVVINSRPAPNEIDICGDAVALDCPVSVTYWDQ